ncbi:MAG: hypothetical protein K0Q93_3183 [Nocardioidaceae bacterium]|jgi:hypothetical protein|nr:hypothetical protein [Nocardioidaceae bacterium]
MSSAGDRATIQAARFALIGAIAGAAIGVGGSYVGAYLTIQNQTRQELVEERRLAYLKLATEAEQYRRTLTDARDAIGSGDQESWTQLRALLLKQSSTLYAAATQAYFAMDEGETAVANGITRAFFRLSTPTSVKDCDLEDFNEALGAGSQAINHFVGFARSDLRELQRNS